MTIGRGGVPSPCPQLLDADGAAPEPPSATTAARVHPVVSPWATRGEDAVTAALGTDAHEPPVTAAVTFRAGSPTPLALLVGAAVEGDESAWNGLVRRYAPLVRRVARQYRLNHTDADDLHQVLWLRVFQHLADLREPDALPGWISSTARREAMRIVNSQQRTELIDPFLEARFTRPEFDPAQGVDAGVIRAERRRAIQAGLAELGAEHRQLLLLLVADPPLSYRQISERLDIPIGSIGPTRARCLRKLAATATIRALLA